MRTTIRRVRRRRSGYRTNPWLIRLTGFRAVVEISAVPRNGLALRSGEDDLEQLHRSNAETGDGAGEIEPPHAREVRAVGLAHLLVGTLEALEPVLERPCVVQTYVLDVEHAVILWLEDLHDAAQCRRMSAGKYP